MAHFAAQLVADLTHAHFIVAPERAVHQQTIGAAHGAQQRLAHLAQARRIEQLAAGASVFDEQADVVARMRIVAVRRIRRRRTAQRNRSDDEIRTGRDDEAAVQRDGVPLQAAVPVLEHVEQRKARGQVLVDHLGAPDFMRAAFTQGQQAGGVIDLAVEQDDRADRRIARLARRLQGGKGLQLRTDVRRGIAENPVHAVVADGDGRLGTRLAAQGAGAQARTVGAVAVPLRKTTARSGTENLDEHGTLPDQGPGRSRGGTVNDWRSTSSLRNQYADRCTRV